MSERTQALADAILALTWKEMMDLTSETGFSGINLPACLTDWAEANRAPTVEVIVEDEQPTGAG